MSSNSKEQRIVNSNVYNDNIKNKNQRYRDIRANRKNGSLARKMFNQFREDYPYDGKTLLLESYFYIEERKYEEAKEALEAIDHKELFAKWDLIKVYISLGQIDEAADIYLSLKKEEQQAYRQAYYFFADFYGWSINKKAPISAKESIIYEYNENKVEILIKTDLLKQEGKQTISSKIDIDELLIEITENIEVDKGQIEDGFLTKHAYRKEGVGTVNGIETDYLIVETIPGTNKVVKFFPTLDTHNYNVSENKEEENVLQMKKVPSGLQKFQARYGK